MAKVKKPVEWITVRYRDVYMIIGVIIALIVIAGGGFLYYHFIGNPKVRAEKAIERADKRLEETINQGVGTDANIRLVRQNISKAKESFQSSNYGQALKLANEALETLKSISEQGGGSFASLVDMDGEVEIKKANAHIFQKAKKGVMLSEGDIVKTSVGATAKIKYPNSEYHDVFSDSFYLIEKLKTVGDSTEVQAKLEQGSIEKITPPDMNPKDQSIISTENAQFKSDKASRLSVEKKEGEGTKAQVLSGKVTAKIGQETREINAEIKAMALNISESGSVQMSELISPPKPVQPRAEQIIQLEDPSSTEIIFEWESNQNGNAIFQLSPKPIFQRDTTIVDKTLSTNNLKIKGLLPSTYYWRVRTAGNEDKCYWSTSQRFKIVQKIKAPKIERNIKLDVTATMLGDGVILRGSTNPGVHISVNDIEIPVNGDGSFSKIIIFSDLGTQVIVVRAFDDQGNEKIWQKSFKSSQM
jgi:hypothetical protein